MPLNGSGSYVATASTWNPAVTTTTINSTDWNSLLSDLSTVLSTAVYKDGQTTPTANIPMGGFKITSIGAATARTDAASIATIQDGTGIYVATVGGTADAITLTPSPAITGYSAGQAFYWIASGVNTGAATLQVSGLASPKAITKNGSTALVAGDIPSGALLGARYDGTRFQLFAPIGVPSSGGSYSGAVAFPDGTAAAPSVKVGDEQNGLYSSAANELAASVGGVNGWTLSSSSFTLPRDLLFTDATYDIGKSGATRPRDGFFSRNMTVGALVDLSGASAGQVKFPATQNPSADANTLDDYEEGTWTPVFTFGTPGNLTIVYSIQSGIYLKVGQLVYMQFQIAMSTFTHTTAAGNASITGVPFGSQNTTGAENEGALAWGGITKANYTNAVLALGANSVTLNIRISGSAQGIAVVAFGDMPTGGTPNFIGTITYKGNA